MIDLPRETRRRPLSVWTALRSCFLLLAGLALFGPRTVAQALNPGGPVDFGSLPVNGGGSNTLTLVFNASTTTDISAVTATTAGATQGDFQVGYQNCTGIQAPPSSCFITLTFSPTSIGLRRGALLITDNSGAVVNIVFLHGIGLAAQMILAPASTAPVDLGVSGLSPTAAITDGNGNLFFTDLNSNSIFERTPAGVNATVASLPLSANSSLAVSGQGLIYESSPGTAKILAINPAGGSPTSVSTGSITLVRPAGIAIDGLGYLYIADAGNNSIVRVNLDGSGAVALTFSGLSTPLSNPSGLAVDASNDLYIADTGNNRIIKASLLTGKASIVALANLSLNSPQGLALDPAGSITVADTDNGRLITIPASGTPFVLGTPGAKLVSPVGLFTEPNGDILLSDTTAGMLLVSRSSLALTFPTSTKVGSPDIADGTLSTIFQNSGNLPLQLTIPGSGSNPSISTAAFALDVSSTCPVMTGSSTAGSSSQLSVGALCTYASAFTPINTGINTAQLAFSASALAGGASVSQTVTLKGTGYSTLAAFKVVASPTPTTPGAPVTLTVTAFTNTGAVATDYLGTITFSATDATAVFPAGFTYTFTAADSGTHTFTAPAGVRFNALGTFTVSVADNSITGTSNPVQVINPPSVTLSSSANPVFVSGSTVLAVSVTAAAGTPTGTVTFYNGSTALGTATLVNGAASLSVPFNTAGTYTLTASYSGDATFAATPSNTILETVQNATATIALTSSANPMLAGGSTILSVLVSSNFATPTGTVTFLDAGAPLGTATLVNGAATLPASFSITGAHTLTVTYSGDSTFTAGASNPVVEVVEDFAIAVAPGASSSASANPGSPASFSLLVSPVGGSTFAAPVTYTVSGTPTAAKVTFAPASIVAGIGPSYLNLTIVPAADRVARLETRPRRGSHLLPPIAFAAVFAPLAFFRRRSRLKLTLCLLLLTAGASLGLTGCLSDSSSGYYAPTPHTYPLTITATSGQLTHTVGVSLTVE